MSNKADKSKQMRYGSCDAKKKPIRLINHSQLNTLSNNTKCTKQKILSFSGEHSKSKPKNKNKIFIDLKSKDKSRDESKEKRIYPSLAKNRIKAINEYSIKVKKMNFSNILSHRSNSNHKASNSQVKTKNPMTNITTINTQIYKKSHIRNDSMPKPKIKQNLRSISPCTTIKAKKSKEPIKNKSLIETHIKSRNKANGIFGSESMKTYSDYISAKNYTNSRNIPIMITTTNAPEIEKRNEFKINIFNKVKKEKIKSYCADIKKQNVKAVNKSKPKSKGKPKNLQINTGYMINSYEIYKNYLTSYGNFQK